LQQSATEILGAGASLNIQGARATLTLSGVSADSLAQFLAKARNKSHALPIEAHLQKFSGTSSGTSSGTASGKATSAKELWRGALILNLPSR
jgi:general secretion pathway protein M